MAVASSAFARGGSDSESDAPPPEPNEWALYAQPPEPNEWALYAQPPEPNEWALYAPPPEPNEWALYAQPPELPDAHAESDDEWHSWGLRAQRRLSVAPCCDYAALDTPPSPSRRFDAPLDAPRDAPLPEPSEWALYARGLRELDDDELPRALPLEQHAGARTAQQVARRATERTALARGWPSSSNDVDDEQTCVGADRWSGKRSGAPPSVRDAPMTVEPQWPHNASVHDEDALTQPLWERDARLDARLPQPSWVRRGSLRLGVARGVG